MLDITLEAIRTFSHRSVTMVTVDAPLFGIVTIMHGQVLVRGTHEAELTGKSLGFPAQEQILAEAKRFWIQHNSGVRERKTRDEMIVILREHQHTTGSS